MRTAGVLVAAAALFVTSCSGKLQPSRQGNSGGTPAARAGATRPGVVGKWLTPTGGFIEFKADGGATMGGAKGSQAVRYRLPDERTIEISRPGGTATIRWQVVSLGAQELVIKDTDGKEVRLRRDG